MCKVAKENSQAESGEAFDLERFSWALIYLSHLVRALFHSSSHSRRCESFCCSIGMGIQDLLCRWMRQTMLYQN